MSEEERYIIEFQPRPKTKPAEWLPVSGLLFKSKERAEEEAEKEEKELGVPTRVTRQPRIYEVWNFRKLMSRMEGTTPALREMKKRGKAGAIAGWAIYKRYIKGLLKTALKPEAADPAYRTTMITDLEAVGEDELVEQIEGLHRKHPEGIPLSERLDLIEDWDESLERRVGRKIPRTPDDLTREEIEESKRITRELHKAEEKKKPEEKITELEEMKEQLEERMKKLRGE